MEKKLIDFVLGVEVQEILNIRFPSGIIAHKPTVIKMTLEKIAWNYLKNGQTDIPEYISEIIEESLLKITCEAGIQEMITMDIKELKTIKKNIGYFLNDLVKHQELTAIIIEAGIKKIMEGRIFKHLEGLRYLIPAQPPNQQIINRIHRLRRKLGRDKLKLSRFDYFKLETRRQELEKLANFLKKSVFIKKN